MENLLFLEGNIYPNSIIVQGQTAAALAKLTANGEKRLLVQGDMDGFDGEMRNGLLVCDLTAPNGAELRSRFRWLNPVPLARQTSFGFGDRLGSATPGHIASLRAANPSKSIGPIFAQQSVRENRRTGRTPQEVLDDAMWAVFQEG